MLRFVIVYLVPIALAIFGLVDCALTPRPYVRAIPKPLWFLAIILLPVIGALLWIVVGRAEEPVRGRHQPRRRSTDIRGTLLGGFGETGTHARGVTGSGGNEASAWKSAPDDDPEFLRKLSEQMRKDRPEG